MNTPGMQECLAETFALIALAAELAADGRAHKVADGA
jgi:hypothetical protein